MIIAHIIYWIGAIADYDSTRDGLKDGFQEGNPVIKYLLDNLPFTRTQILSALKLIVWGVLFVLAAPAWVYIVLGVTQGLIAYRNYKIVRER